MTDVDILVPEAGAVAVEEIALRKGFQHRRPVMEPDSHHREPLYHREKHTKVEIHTGLFQNPRLRQGRLFDPARVLLESVPCQIHGRQARCLPDELQLAYIASSWTKDLSEQSIHPSLIAPIFDAIHLLRASGRPLDWHRLVASLDNELAAASLYVLIVCLARMNHPGVPPCLIAALRDRQSIIGEPELRVLLALIENFLVSGRYFPVFNSWHVLVEPVQTRRSYGQITNVALADSLSAYLSAPIQRPATSPPRKALVSRVVSRARRPFRSSS